MIAVEQNTFGISEALIQQVTERIVRECHPHKIILFGSFAWGKPKCYSDLDLFVIMDSDLRRDRRAAKISQLFPHRRFPMDVIAYTPEEVQTSLKRGNPFIRDILEKGRVLYAR
jgi:predicted nucleotidyltransferase